MKLIALMTLVVALVLAACGRAPSLAVAPAPQVLITPLAPNQSALALSDLEGATHVVMVWRSDCAPCLIELEHMARLREAAGDARIVLVALEDAASARRALARYGIEPAETYAAAGDPQEFLETVSEGGRRLPYALALTPDGRVCARRAGLLGTDHLREWSRRCSA